MKIDDEANLQTGQLQIGQQLRLMDWQYLIDALDLHDRLLITNDIHSIATIELDPFVLQRQWFLPFHEDLLQL
jgi:hypothetical protein